VLEKLLRDSWYLKVILALQESLKKKDSCEFKGECTSLRKEIFEVLSLSSITLYYGHLDVKKIYADMKNIFLWVGMNDDVF